MVLPDAIPENGNRRRGNRRTSMQRCCHRFIVSVEHSKK